MLATAFCIRGCPADSRAPPTPEHQAWPGGSSVESRHLAPFPLTRPEGLLDLSERGVPASESKKNWLFPRPSPGPFSAHRTSFSAVLEQRHRSHVNKNTQQQHVKVPSRRDEKACDLGSQACSKQRSVHVRHPATRMQACVHLRVCGADRTSDHTHLTETEDLLKTQLNAGNLHLPHLRLGKQDEDEAQFPSSVPL